MSRIYEALRKVGDAKPGRATDVDRSHLHPVEREEADRSGRARPDEAQSLRTPAPFQWPPPEPVGDSAGFTREGAGPAPLRPQVAGVRAELSFSELIRAIARDEQELGS